ncbi:Chorismate mutase [Macleaya cordata]|uniref:Chorismate mutase n=1 Tax=Macleaya cordata TaxID=56857 RepID=A0A200QFI8_MACCD|nr:Chorismate mutase [Macleaya cordata]
MACASTDISPRFMENGNSDSKDALNLETIRKSLIRQEDTIVFSLIERAKFPLNSPVYEESSSSSSSFLIPGCFDGSLVQYIVKETEILHAKVGRYESPEEHPFFPDDLPRPLLPAYNYPQVLHPAASCININKTIWKFYFDELLPLFTKEGDDGNYGSTAACDLGCLQALSRRIHYGKFVAEVKFRDAPEDYGPAIRAQDRDALMKLLTFIDVEEMVKRRVEKKAMVFAQEVSLNDKEDNNRKYKIDPSIVSRLYGDWVMPLTKLVQVEYLLRRLD